jgi:hypothetical protein
MNISFGRKLPIIKCQIQDTDTGKFEPATVYQIDCKDEADSLEIRNLPDTWQYKLGITKDMERKHQLLKHYNQENDSIFYALEDSKNRIIGLGELEETETGVYDLKYLESNSLGAKKYVGQVLLASMADDILCRNGRKLTVNDAVDSAFDFYANTCGFEDVYGYYLKMNRGQINNFIEQTEDRTQALLLNLRG